MTDSDPIAESIAAMARFYVGDSTLVETLRCVTELTATAVPPAAYTGITMLVDGKPETSAFSDPEAPEIDQAQYDADTGPCLDAFRDGEVYGIPSTEDDERWPEFSRTALAHGIRSTLSLPLIVGGDSLGALNLYSEDMHGFTEAHHKAAELFAAQAAVVLANSQAYWDAHTLSENMKEAMASRAAIEQAKGILIAQSGVDPEAAFQLLKRASQRENRKLRDVASELVARNVKD
jgi:GAF domain-containing protein